tara:strand:- start:2017 stop:2178 length:162 start_codon:yes stop_codon:yes gene_type:complete
MSLALAITLEALYLNAPICADCQRLGSIHQLGSKSLWQPYGATDEDGANLQED